MLSGALFRSSRFSELKPSSQEAAAMGDVEIVVVLAAPALVERTRSVEPIRVFGAKIGTTVHLRPIVPSPNRLPYAEQASRSTPFAAELQRFLVGQAPAQEAEELAATLRARPDVETAYTKPRAENPIARMISGQVEAPLRSDSVPDFRARQGYLDVAPGGIGVAHAWKLQGGRGSGVRVIDIEGAWQFSHVDLGINSGGLVGGAPIDDVDWRNHGTAVLAQIGGDDNTIGVTGIAPDAVLSAVSHDDLGSAVAIYQASQKLMAGDVLLLEMHRPGPRFNYASRDDQRGFICVEWWADDLLAIQHAVARGIVVVEAAGNGAENLDDGLYESPGPSFPSNWNNPLRNSVSGAILVGAGATPGAEYGADRSRLDYSNYGGRVDCQGWGCDVVSAGYGDLFCLAEAPDLEDYWYTAQFGGTSSASPIVAGAVACLQGIARKRGAALSPARIAQALRTTGSAQQGSLSTPIGNRPDLQALIHNLFGL